MSRESIEWLNNNVLMGYTNDREHWATQGFVNAGTNADGSETNRPWFATDNYTGGFGGPVPVEAVMERLFNWQALEGPLSTEVPCSITEADTIDQDGNPMRRVVLPEHKAILRSDNSHVMGIFKQGYQPHQYDRWLIENVANILDDEVLIDSAGLLMGGGVAWVSISLPETAVGDAGFGIRPRILAFTSHNGKHATTYQRSVNAPVCDNSLDLEIAGADRLQRVKIKHSSNSHLRIADARDALGILYSDTEQYTDFFDKLAAWEVTNRQFKAVLDELEPVELPDVVDGKVKNQRKITMAENRRNAIASLYVSDHRAAPWQGSALGVLQAFNTFDQQERNVVGERVERQMLDTLAGSVRAFDHRVLDMVGMVTGRDAKDLVAA
jgi:phage/plasmid-like protein (TIGR03299 family)